MTRYDLIIRVSVFLFGSLPHALSFAQNPILFEDDFTSTSRRDDSFTNIMWDTDSGTISMSGPRAATQTFGVGIAPEYQVGEENEITGGVALGDMDGDGWLDLVVVDYRGTNKLYLNNRSSIPYEDVAPAVIDSTTDRAHDLALGDVDNDGDLDAVVGNAEDLELGLEPEDEINRVFLNNGTQAPFEGIVPVDITSDAAHTHAIILGDVDDDGDLDAIAGNGGNALFQVNRLYRNNGSYSPWEAVAGENISSDTDHTESVVLADMDSDGDLDLVVGNCGDPGQANKLYLNNGAVSPFSGVVGLNISEDRNGTRIVSVADLNGDGRLDVAAGNFNNQKNRIYLNNGTADPFAGVQGTDLSEDQFSTDAMVAADFDSDGNIDLVVGNLFGPLKLFLNNGSHDPFQGVQGIEIAPGGTWTWDLDVGDIDRDGDLDLVAGNHLFPEPDFNRYYLNRADSQNHGQPASQGPPYDTSRGAVVSLNLNSTFSEILSATLTSGATIPLHTQIDYWLSNDGGTRWWIVRPGERFDFPNPGSDLRWRAHLSSWTPLSTPILSRIRIQASVEGLPGDINKDDRVDSEDLLRILGRWKEAIAVDSPEDLHPNGVIDPLDLVLFQSFWRVSLDI